MSGSSDALSEEEFPTRSRKGREWINTVIEVALLWLAVIVVIAFWR